MPPASDQPVTEPVTDAAVPDSGRRRWSRRTKRRVVVVAIVVAMLASCTVAAAMVKVPYWAYAPGRMHDTEGVIRIDGAEVYPTEGDIAFATVSIRGRLSLLRYAVSWLDPNAVIVPEVQVIGTRDADENRRINLQLMDLSTQISTFVALERLGYEVAITGTGAMVTQVEEDQPADGVLEVGDTIVAVDGLPVNLADDLFFTISARDPGETVTMTVEPLGSDDTDEREVTLGARPDSPERAFLGVVPQTRDTEFVFPFDIDFNTRGVSGPSAGLAFALSVIDQLTPGDLTGGLRVAVTGTLDVEGNVGPIGGIEFKTSAARRDGFDVFLVPADSTEEELAEARRRAGDALEIIPVETLDEALEALVELGGDPVPST